MGGSAGHHYCNSQAIDDCEAQNAYLSAKGQCDQTEVIYQNTNVVGGQDSLFYTPVKIGESVTLSAMLDSGSIACTMNESAEMELKSAGVLNE